MFTLSDVKTERLYSVRVGEKVKTKGQRIYEADLIERPFYHDGKSRRTWDQLADWAKRAWEKNPYPLPCPPEDANGN